jgi:hypothetical protein
MVLQFENRFKNENADFLPNFICYEEQDGVNGSSALTNKLNEFTANIDNNNFTIASNNLRWLINYQVVFNFWDKSTYKVHDINAIQLKQKSDSIEGLIQLVKSLQSELTIIKIEHTAAIQSLIDFQNTKDAELKTISNSLNTVNNQTTEVNQIWSNATKLNSEIVSVFASAKAQYEDIKIQLEKQDEKFNIQINDTETLKKELVDEIEASKLQFQKFNLNLEFIESKKAFIIEKEEEIIKLTGFAADGTLGFTFNKRKDELSKSGNRWLIAIPIMTLLTLAWIFLIFYCFPSDIDTEWLSTLINSIKTLPAILLFFFVIKQYTKERNLQEEYAFKATVAMTLKAYADQIHGETDGDRRKMLLDAIDKIYSAPKINSDNGSIISFRTKPLTDSIKGLTEITNNLLKNR